MLRWLTLLAALGAVTLEARTKKILIEGNPPFLKQLQAASRGARIVPVTPQTALAEIPDADAYIGPIRPELVQAGRNLTWVQIMSAGVENVLFREGGEALRHSAIVLTNNKIVQGPEIADHAMAMLLMLSRRLNLFVRNQMRGEWNPPRPFPGIELRGKHAVVIGAGGIGMQIAQRAWGFGMQVVGVDPEDKPFSPFLTKVVKPDQLDEVLPSADVVFVSAPDTPLSRKMMGPRQFERMKPHAYFIAVSRGKLYDLDALVKALDSQRLDGAGVDVTDPEPLPPGHPLWKFENVIVTPHIAGRSDQDQQRMVDTIRENIRRFVDGKPLLNVVDKQKGY
jgi:phosphoglycerate dehydrogenase-like enzyme